MRICQALMHHVGRVCRPRLWMLCCATMVLAGVGLRAFAQSPPPSSSPSSSPPSSPAPTSPPASSAVPPPALPEDAAASRATVTDPAQTPNPHAIQLRAIEERVNALKERIFAAKAKLLQLQEAILHGTASGARVLIIHRNEMSKAFTLRRLQYTLDGTPIFNVQAAKDATLDQRNEIEIFSAGILPGKHTVTVYVEYMGNGFGMFDYWNGYTFKHKAAFNFTVEESKRTTVRAVGYEKGGMTEDLHERPAIRFDVETVKAVRQGPPDVATHP